MKQVLQSLGNGEIAVVEAPCPAASPGSLLIRSSVSLISAGTERMLVDFGRGSLLSKARQQPDKVKELLEKVRTDGLASTLEAVRSKLDQPIAPGYCNVGRVLETGVQVDGFAVGDRVVSNGKHAEVVAVPRNLCARVPENVDDESAAFTVLGAIALQGVRLAQPTLGESLAVVGLGLIGLMAVQILRANGCRVLGVDLDPSRLALARQFGADIVDLGMSEDPLAAAAAFSRGRGIDAVLLTASTTSNEPMKQAAQMCRKRGRIVLVGVTGLELSREDFYAKELSFQVSCSYGPGRYDSAYEEQGHDYPVGFVRWTGQRNFEAILDLLAAGALDVRPLITHRFDIGDAPKAYDVLASDKSSLGILIRYPKLPAGTSESPRRTVPLPGATRLTASAARKRSDPVLGFVGAGNYASRVLISAFKATGATLHTLVTASGVSAAHHGGRHGFHYASTDPASVMECNDVNTIVIATRHNTHARFVEEALKAGKSVFVEKPLALTLDELEAIRGAHEAAAASNGRTPMLMVGFNRRFAPHVVKIAALLAVVREPKYFVMTVNAGVIAPEHWTQDPAVGGGRLVGEACHFIDLLRHLAGAPIAGFEAFPLGVAHGPSRSDNATIVLRFADGSMGTVHYVSKGYKSFPKERLEVFAAGRVLQLDNFRALHGYGWPGFSRMNLWRQDKGHTACAAAFVAAVRAGGSPPIPFDELLEVSRVAVEVAERA